MFFLEDIYSVAGTAPSQVGMYRRQVRAIDCGCTSVIEKPSKYILDSRNVGSALPKYPKSKDILEPDLHTVLVDLAPLCWMKWRLEYEFQVAGVVYGLLLH